MAVTLALSIATVLVAATVGVTLPYADYMQQRSQVAKEEKAMRLGSKLVLRPDEKIVSDIFVKEKAQVINSSVINRELYYPALSFYVSKPMIEKTKLFKLIQQMPKGASLHLHDFSLASLDWVVKNATYRDHVYMCMDNSIGLLKFQVFQTPPKTSDCEWKLVKAERAAASDVQEFDLLLKKNLSMLQTDPVKEYGNNAQAWIRFAKYFNQIAPLLMYIPIFRDYYWAALEECRADNVQYIEWRGVMSGFYDLDGTKYNAEFGVQLCKNVTESFVQMYPDFSGAKVIISGSRSSDVKEIFGQVKSTIYLHQKYPNFVMGYDLVGNEVFYNPLIYYVDPLLYPSQQNPPYHLPYFFHAGETDWEGNMVDDNLLDAILLNTTRIGHGYALTKHPRLMQIVKSRQIPVEVNPISNQVLRLVTDLRNHPMASLMADDFPIVICSDDWPVWEATPLSHDMYLAFMDMAGEDADLTLLKQLAINSIKYSSMNQTEQDIANKLWEIKWDKFIGQVLSNEFGLPSSKFGYEKV